MREQALELLFEMVEVASGDDGTLLGSGQQSRAGMGSGFEFTGTGLPRGFAFGVPGYGGVADGGSR